MPITLWDDSELRQIANMGFEILGIRVENSIVDRLISEGFGSPHLMQSFCNALCIQNDIRESGVDVVLKAPSDWNDFFRNMASGTSKLAFERLAMGPRQRTERISRITKDGEEVDIYKAILIAIANTGPRLRLTYEEIRSAMRDVLVEPPQAHEITRVLDKMTEIARDQIDGEPVVEWDKLHPHISDPFFAYYLKWGIKQ